MGILVPRDVGREAEDGGEVGVVAVACFHVDSSPELMPAADREGRRCRRRPGDGNKRVSWQEDAQDKKNAKYGTKEAWRGSRRPELQLPAGGNGGAPGSFPSSPVALGWDVCRKSRGEMPGVL